jgi:hypothetical protein
MDHDHSCCEAPSGRRTKLCGACNRGVLCQNCNFMIGQAGDDPDRLVAGAAYLLQYTDMLQRMIPTAG